MIPSQHAGELDFDRLFTDRVKSIDASGIRRAFDRGASIVDPINLSIGQPDFHVADRVKHAAIRAIEQNRNGYSLTQGVPELRTAIWAHLQKDLGWTPSDDLDLIITSGTTGALVLAAMALIESGDEVIMPDPYFVAYPQFAKVTGGCAVLCDTYPDFRMTAKRIAPLITARTKMVIIDSPSNPCGVVLTSAELAEIVELCRERGILLVSDEIYDAFTFPEALEGGRCPSPARNSSSLLLVRGFGKSYGCTGWRLGYAAGPKPLIQQMAKLQQYLFVCAPTPLQYAAAECFSVDLSPIVDSYVIRRNMVVDALAGVTNVTRSQGAFYAFIEIPKRLGMTGTQFAEQVIAHKLIVVPGGVFSSRDTHIRISFAAPERKLAEGLEVIRRMMA
ncbi:MAG: aminotransferase class I/II-fold pyridoxal phosphate-dependent enzyme [Phycisphaerales bacterium]|nr:aminotransferase class I/II-fold pyridoxal phosphate-dependent enzyme [Phycisphaerales bacterium]